MTGKSPIEFSLFGAPVLRRVDNDQVVKFRAKIKCLLAALVLEGDANFGMADDNLVMYLWHPDETRLDARLTGLVHESREVLRHLGVDGDKHLERSDGKVFLRHVTVDTRDFNIAYGTREWSTALSIAEHGPLMDGLSSRSVDSTNDWIDRARRSYGTKIVRCHRELTDELVKRIRDGTADIAELVDLFERRVRAAVAYDLIAEADAAREQLDKLTALADSRTLDVAPVPNAQAAAPEHRPQAMPVDRLLVTRLGSGLSLHVDPEHVDAIHRYTRVARTDLLDYPSGDFYSLRRLCGVNVSGKSSPSVVYAESSEARITFDATQTKAYDTETRKRLAVEPLLPSNVALYQHGFRIFFPRPLAPDEPFDVTFAIRLPGELAVLSPVEEMMSIALVRWQCGVEHLDFRVCLNFEPLAVQGEYVSEHGEFVQLDVPLTVEEYTPEAWYERDLDIAWSAQPYAASYSVEAPESPMYTIKYRV